ncbi:MULTISPECIES: MetQ/NlpA family ABC transporter substrate-binding protein [Actinokineospora]|uniref:Lipoprotein n=1 Tax=Actinokineospora fastidiosa TaxID=1816 RepID=A0A918GT66_9PSEU|nr:MULTISPECIES: MetQ/NlpA family ABC transporter substrate-binding protein [Actinokineospora]UVS79214.1 Methionine-binding lipoprotein MetQ precursor [Actinokineospora sp. UTMC 2448]GGS58786.1 lipoprotein [Actinokineospora fastidiosa]
MRKAISTTALSVAAALALTACGSEEPAAGDATLSVGASITPHAEILKFVQEELAPKAGIELEIVEYEDYVLPNENLADGTLHANYFQHKPYFDAQVAERGYEFGHFPGVHIEPYALYSGREGGKPRYTSTKDLPDGAVIGITNDPSNQARALNLLVKDGLITLKDPADPAASVLDVQDNPKGLRFQEADPASLARTLEDVDAAIINGNYALEADLSATNDSLLVESGQDNPYANFLAYRKSDEGNAALTTLDRLLRSPEVRGFIQQRWPNGEVLPAF